MKGYNLSDMEGKEVLITGGLGFIGSNIAHKCASLNANVTIYDACLDPYGWNFANIREIKNKIKLIKGDTRDFELVKKTMNGKDIVFDCASQISHTISVKQPFLDLEINCKGPLNLLEAARKANDGVKFVYAGTRGQIGKMMHSPIGEEHPTNPVDMNGINKLAAEKYYLLYNKLYGIKATSLRINNAYGIRCQMRHGDYAIVNWFIRKALLSEQIAIYGTGKQTRDYSYVEDIVDAMVLAAQSKKADGEYFMVGTEKPISLIDMCNLILKAAGSKMKISHLEWDKERKSIEIGNFCVSYKKLKKVLGWHPKTPLLEGLKKTVEFYRERKDEYF